MVSKIGPGGGCGSLLLNGVSGDLLGVCGTKGVLSLFGVSIPGRRGKTFSSKGEGGGRESSLCARTERERR